MSAASREKKIELKKKKQRSQMYLSSGVMPLLIQRGASAFGVVVHGANSKETGEVSHRTGRAGEAAEMEESGSDG